MMKKIVIMMGCCMTFIMAYPQNIEITTDQTTSLIFPFPVQHVDRGSANILVQPVPEATHILLVKASAVNFPATNLTVITTDGSAYSLPIRYVTAPVQWVYVVEPRKEISIEGYANHILDHPRTMRGMKDHAWDMHGRVIGIYIKDHTIYYQLRLSNNSPIDYEPDFLRVYIRDLRKGKRTATQENEMIPQYIAGNIREVKAYSEQDIVIALEKYTIPDAKVLAIQMMEKNGGRHLLMKVSNRKIMQAILLSDLH